MKTEIKELLLEAYNSEDVCQTWKDKIKAAAPEVVHVEIEVGKWYKFKITYMTALICITELDLGRIGKDSIWHYHYGFQDGIWMDEDSWSNTEMTRKLTPATDQEVQDALEKEAIKRYPIGTKFKNIRTGFIQTVVDGNHYIGDGYDGYSVFCGQTTPKEWMEKGSQSNAFIFNNGKWAEIISKPSIQEQRIANDKWPEIISKTELFIQEQLTELQNQVNEIKAKL